MHNFLVCSCASNYADFNSDYGTSAYGGKCYTMMDGAIYLNWLEAQAYCQNVGVGNYGRLATFSSCAAYATIKAYSTYSNLFPMWIGIQNASGSPYWADPNGVCSSQEIFNATDWNGICSSSVWNPSGQSCIEIQGGWGDLNGQACASSLTSILCEFGKF